MLLRTPPRDAGTPIELKVRVSRGMHIRLHAQKVLTGKPLGQTVVEALESYFAAR